MQPWHFLRYEKMDVCIVSKKNSVFCRLELQTASLVNFFDIFFIFSGYFPVLALNKVKQCPENTHEMNEVKKRETKRK